MNGLTQVVVLIAIAVMSGCAPRQPTYARWVSNSNAPQDQFMKDRYTCYQETRERVSAAYANQYGGASGSRVVPSCDAFAACLAARGYYQVADTTDLSDFQKPGNYFVPVSAIIRCNR